MKTTIPLLSIGILFFAAVALSFAMPAHAAMAPQSRLVTMQTDGADVNYDSLSTTGLAGQQTNAFPFEVAIVIIGLFLLYMVVLVIMARYKKNPITIHSHALVRRH